MRKLIAISLAALIIVLLPSRAEAGLVVAAIKVVAGWWTALGATTLGMVAQAAIRIGAGLVISGALARRQSVSTPQLKREFPMRTTLPAKRTVYGHTETTGTPVPWRVRDGYLYGCLLLNSRPSAGTNLSLTVDGRACVFADRTTGDELTDPDDWEALTDFSSDGELVKITEQFPEWTTNREWFVCWLGLGDQTAPPDRLLDEVPEFFQATDGWQGRTVLWVRMRAGGVELRTKRWPTPEPVVAVTMDWSRVWDPGDAGQDRDDPETWTWSDNQARCLLDAIRFNPVRSYSWDEIYHETFTAAVPLADEAVTLWHASQDAGETVTEPRYRVGGAVDWSRGELLDLLQPLADAGAGALAMQGGRLAYVAGEAQASSFTMSDIIGDSIEFQRYGARRDIPYALRGTWTSEERGFETASLGLRLVAGGSTRPDDVEEYPLSMVPSGYQAQRIVKIEAERRSRQKRLTCVLRPPAINLLPGAAVTGDLPAPFTRLNGGWQVETADPGIWLQDGDEGRVVFRVPVTLREYDAAIFDWDPETDEEEVLTQDLSEEDADLGTVQNLSAQTVEIDSGGARILMLEFSFDPITEYQVDTYELGWREEGETEFTPLPDIPGEFVDDAGRVSGRFGPVGVMQPYDIRVRATGPTSVGLWSYVLGVVAGLEASVSGSTPQPGALAITGTAPDTGYFEGLRLYRADPGEGFAEAVQVGEDIAAEAGAGFDVVFGNAAPTELVTGGDFSDPGDWTTSGGWTVSGGVAEHEATISDGTVAQALALTEGAIYRVSFTASALSGSGDVLSRLTGSADVDGSPISGAGAISERLTAPAGASGVAIWSDALRDVTVDDLSVQPVTDADLPAGAAEFWLVPFTRTGTNGTPTALGSITIT